MLAIRSAITIGSRTLRTALRPRTFVTQAVARMGSMNPRAQEVLDFWFGPGWEAAPPSDAFPARSQSWFRGGPEFDAEITQRFGDLCEGLLRGELDSWQSNGGVQALAGIIVGDQFFRNAYRGTAKMYAADPIVLPWTKALVASGRDKELTPMQRMWLVLPFMHSEGLADLEECVRLAEVLLEDAKMVPGADAVTGMIAFQVDYAKRHRDVVANWGRFPHRNALLGRESTPEEAAGLADGSIEGF